MLASLFDLPRDKKEAAVLERRRNLEEKRKERIFNARNRIMGLDTGALSHQIQEKAEREETERRLDQAFFDQAVKDAQLGIHVQKKVEDDLRAQAEAINEFNSFQYKEERREFDLYDPDRLKKLLPGRIDDRDPRNGVSGGQRFEGEDLAEPERKKIQNAQQRAWLEQQLEEKQAAEKERKLAEEFLSNTLRMRDLRLCELEMQERNCRRQIAKEMMDYNLIVASEKSTACHQAKEQEHEDDRAELINCITSDLLTENPKVGMSSFGPGRLIPDRFKGMSPEQVTAIREEQLRQVKEKEEEKRAEEQRQAEWDRMTNNATRTAILIERDQIRKLRERNVNYFKENEVLSQEQKCHQEYMNKIVYINPPTPAYFEQFNTTSR